MRGWRTFTKSQAGLSLVEATIILMVLAILTSVLAPSMQDFIDDARKTKAKEDCEAIGLSVQRLRRDTGAPFLLRIGDLDIEDRYEIDNRVDLLVSTGDTPGVFSGVNNGPTQGTGNIEEPGDLAWDADPGEQFVGTMYDHLVSNEVSYIQPTVPFDTNDPQPPIGRGLFGHGWRGAYLSPVIGPDPWGNRYAVNSVYLGTGTDANDVGAGYGIGQHGRGWPFDTICVSAGNNSQIDTNFEDTLVPFPTFNQNGGTSFDETDGAADDIVYVLSGYGM